MWKSNNNDFYNFIKQHFYGIKNKCTDCIKINFMDNLKNGNLMNFPIVNSCDNC